MSIFMCELTAIYLTLNWIQDFNPVYTVIFVDSLSALLAIKGYIYKVKQYIIYDILYSYIMLGRGICEKYQSRQEKFPEPYGEGNLVPRLVLFENTLPKHDISVYDYIFR